MTSDELHGATDELRLAYYGLVVDALNRYIQDGHPFALETDGDGERTKVLFIFDGPMLSPYMQHLEPLSNGPQQGHDGAEAVG